MGRQARESEKKPGKSRRHGAQSCEMEIKLWQVYADTKIQFEKMAT